jgi:hypothetical protein
LSQNGRQSQPKYQHVRKLSKKDLSDAFAFLKNERLRNGNPDIPISNRFRHWMMEMNYKRIQVLLIQGVPKVLSG